MRPLEEISESYIRQSFDIEETSALSEAEIFISGGTGFSGRWVATVLRTIFNPENFPNVTVISRSPTKALKIFSGYPNLDAVDWKDLESRIRQLQPARKVIAFHASVPAASGEPISIDEVTRLTALTESYALMLSSQENPPIFVNLSSGALYLRPEAGNILESGGALKNLPTNTYDMVKFADEETVSRLTHKGLINGVNPRLFSFTGPGLEIPGKFALGSFLCDALENRAVKVTGNENSLRSYMSPIDMGIWILKAAIYPTSQTIHIGSAEGLKMIEIAKLVADNFGNGQIEISSDMTSKLESYVPETQQSEKLLQIRNTLDFSSSLSMWKAKLV